MPTFIGIDLAWQSDRNHSGGAVLEGDQSAVTLREVTSGLSTLAEVESLHRSQRQPEYGDSSGRASGDRELERPEAMRNGDRSALWSRRRKRTHIELETLPERSQRAVC